MLESYIDEYPIDPENFKYNVTIPESSISFGFNDIEHFIYFTYIPPIPKSTHSLTKLKINFLWKI